MATKTDNSSLFNGVAALIALLLVTAAVLIYMQAGSRDGGPSGNELAALSQAIPSQAARALSGEAAAFEQLDSSVKKVAALRRNDAPGSSSDWQRLESGAAAILAGRRQVEAVRNAADERFSRYARLENVDRHEAKSFNRESHCP